MERLSVPELKLRTPLLLPVPTDCPTLILEVLLDVITSIAAFVVFLISISDAGVSEPIPSLLSTTSAVTVADEPTIFPTVISGIPASAKEVPANPAVCATPLKYPVTLPVKLPVTFPVTLPMILPSKLVEVVTPVTVNPPAVICASSVKVAMPDTTIPVEFVSNFAALTSSYNTCEVTLSG